MNNLFFHLNCLSKFHILIRRRWLQLIIFNLLSPVMAFKHLKRILFLYFLADIDSTDFRKLRVAQRILESGIFQCRLFNPRSPEPWVSQSIFQQRIAPFDNTGLINLMLGIRQLKVIKITCYSLNLTTFNFRHLFRTVILITGLLYVFISFIFLLIKSQYIQPLFIIHFRSLCLNGCVIMNLFLPVFMF